MVGKKKSKKNENVEPHFLAAQKVYFDFYKQHFKDSDGFYLVPDWTDGKGGMERRSLKLILQTLRQISERKNIEWTEEEMKKRFTEFLGKAMCHNLVKRELLCCMMNRFKFEILSSAYNPHLSRKIRELWYINNPDYPIDEDKDRAASEIIAGFLKQQFVLSSLQITDDAILSSWATIINFIKQDEFWKNKSLKSISNNLQEFVYKIKSRKNGQTNSDTKTKQRNSYKTAGQEVFADRLRQRLDAIQRSKSENN